MDISIEISGENVYWQKYTKFGSSYVFMYFNRSNVNNKILTVNLVNVEKFNHFQVLKVHSVNFILILNNFRYVL